MQIKIGDRVGAVAGSKDQKIFFLGYGVYLGREYPSGQVVGTHCDALNRTDRENDKIRLDSGQVVWGCECWWGTEFATKARLKKHEEVVDVDIVELRNRILKDREI